MQSPNNILTFSPLSFITVNVLHSISHILCIWRPRAWKNIILITDNEIPSFHGEARAHLGVPHFHGHQNTKGGKSHTGSCPGCPACHWFESTQKLLSNKSLQAVKTNHKGLDASRVYLPFIFNYFLALWKDENVWSDISIMVIFLPDWRGEGCAAKRSLKYSRKCCKIFRFVLQVRRNHYSSKGYKRQRKEPRAEQYDRDLKWALDQFGPQE